MIGVMNSLEAVIASIQGLSASSEDLSALHDLLKGAEESLRTDWDVKPSTLDQLDPLKHSLGYLYLLEVVTCGPVSKENASDVVLLIAQFINTCDAGQIRLASEKFVTLCKRLKDNVLEIKDPLRGVTPLLKAVHKLQVSTKSLTALHPDLLQLCLQAECYETGFSILSDDIVEVDQPRDFFLYCYYGGMICIGQKKLQKALELLYNVVTAPMHLVNAIALEAYKKYILVSLIHNGQFSNNLPKSASTAAQRDLKNYCIPYVEVGNCYNEGKISELEAIIVANSSDFEKDKNLGLVKQAVSSLYKRNILRLTQKYSTLSLHDIANMVHLANAKEAEMHVLQMIQDSQIHAHINQKDGMVRFLESKKQCRDVEDVKDIATEDDSRGKRRKKEEKQREYEQVEMEKLQNLLFGSLYSPVTFGKQDGVTEADGSALYHVDRSAVDYEDEDEQLSDEEKGQTEGIREGEAAWEDEEEKQININIATVNRLRKLRKEENEGLISGSEYIMRLRAHHAKLNPGTDWARQDSQFVDGESSDDEYEHGGVDAEILRTNEDLVVKFGGTKLCPGLLEYSKLVDANAADPSNGPINSVHFHQNAQLLLTAGLDRRLKFFQIDGKRNTKIQSIFLEDCPIRKAAFLPNGSQVIVSGRRKFFYSFDLENAKFDKIGPLVGREEKSLEHFEVSQDSNTIAFVGNEGYILLVSSKTKELSGTLKMNGSVRSLAFSDDGKQLLSSGGDGQVYLWDLRTMKCLYKGVDEGSTCGTSLCSSLDGALFASGTDKGIVNIYRKSEFVGGKRKPIKTVDNLTSKIDFMQFNYDAQILAIVSTMNKNSVKLVHVPSLTVFSNWPPPNSTMHYPRCLDFSPGSGFMAMGNAAGKVLLYKLHHYQNA